MARSPRIAAVAASSTEAADNAVLLPHLPPATVDVSSISLNTDTNPLLPTLHSEDPFFKEIVELLQQPPETLGIDGAIPGAGQRPALGVAIPRFRRKSTMSHETIPHSLAAVEAHERLAIEHLYEQVSSLSVYEQLRLNNCCRGGATNPDAFALSRSFRAEMKTLFTRRMRRYVESYFDYVFPEGIEGTDLSDVDVHHMADIHMGLPIALDGNLDIIRFPFNPSVRFEMAVVPAEMKPYFFAHLAAKAALANANLTIPEWHEWISLYFYHRSTYDRRAPFHVAVAMAALIQSLDLFGVEGRPEDGGDDGGSSGGGATPVDRGVCASQQSRQEFFQHCLSLERQLHGDTDSCDNSITIEYQRGELLGKGAFGRVFRCTNVETGQLLALKELEFDPAKEQAVRAESSTLKRLSHRNIVKYFGARFDREARKAFVLMEYLPKNLREVAVSSRGGLSLRLVATYGRMILEGLAYLHEHHIIHRDIKASNVLLSETGVCKLTDFGTAIAAATAVEVCEACPMELAKLDAEDAEELMRQRQLARHRQNKQKQHVAGTPLFIAPEVLRGALPSEASDIWSFGCLLHELVTGRPPWPELSGLPMELVLYRISSATVPPQLPQTITTTAAFDDILTRCLTLDPYDRPSARELLSSTFFRDGHATSVTPGSNGSLLSSNTSGTLISTGSSTVHGASSSSLSSPGGGGGRDRGSTEVVGPGIAAGHGSNSSAPSTTITMLARGRRGDQTTLMTETELIGSL